MSVALYLCFPRLSRGSSATGRVEHAAEVLPNAVASAVKRGEAFPLASPTVAAREARETGNEQRASINVCCASHRRPPRLSRWPRASEHVEDAAEVGLNAVASAARRGEAFLLASATIASREACQTSSDQQPSSCSCCALLSRSPRLSRGSSATGRVEHAAEVLRIAVSSAARRGEAAGKHFPPFASPTMAARSMPHFSCSHRWRGDGKCFSPRLAADATALGSAATVCSTRSEAFDPRLNLGERR
jgi:hypothetical protein